MAVESVKGGSVGNERDELLDEEVLLHLQNRAGAGAGAGSGSGAGSKGGLRFANEDRAAASMGHMAAVSLLWVGYALLSRPGRRKLWREVSWSG